MEPLLLNIPNEIVTPRLLLRAPIAGDGKKVAALVQASMAELKPWLAWATDDYDEIASEIWCRRSAAEFLLRQRLPYLIFDRDGRYVGNVGVFAFVWGVPECEIGYWLGTPYVGRGYMAEAVEALTTFLYSSLQMSRIIIRTESQNARSQRVAERAGFRLEGTFQHCRRNRDGNLADECVFARLR